MGSRGQISVEFVIVLALLLTLLLLSLWVFGEKQSGFTHAQQRYEARLLADELAGTINAVHLAGTGAQETVFLEKAFDFDVSTSKNAVVVALGDSYTDAALLTDQVSMTDLTLGQNVRVQNKAGVVFVENT